MNLILAALEGQNKNLVTFWSETGLRTSELVALEWGDIDTHRREVSIWKAKTDAAAFAEPPKTSAGNRIIPLSDKALAAVNNQKSFTFIAGNEVFQNPRTLKPWSGDRQIREILWRPLLKRCGVRYRYPYQIRHTFASIRIQRADSTAKIIYISKLMGHRDWVFTVKTYTRFIPDSTFVQQQEFINSI